MSGSEEGGGPSGGASGSGWWTTLPGVLTGVAAVLTAVGGLVVALRQGAPEPPEAAVAVEAGPDGAAGAPAASVSGRTVEVPPGREAALEGGELTISVVRARVDPFSAGERRVTLTVRFANAGRSFDRTYYTDLRLAAGGAEAAPEDPPLEQVEGHSAREFDYVFRVPAGGGGAVLRLFRGDESREIPLDLPGGA